MIKRGHSFHNVLEKGSYFTIRMERRCPIFFEESPAGYYKVLDFNPVLYIDLTA